MLAQIPWVKRESSQLILALRFHMLLFGRKENKAFGLFGLSGHVVLMCVLGEGVVRFLDSSLGHMSSVVAFLVPS